MYYSLCATHNKINIYIFCVVVCCGVLWCVVVCVVVCMLAVCCVYVVYVVPRKCVFIYIQKYVITIYVSWNDVHISVSVSVVFVCVCLCLCVLVNLALSDKILNELQGGWAEQDQ